MSKKILIPLLVIVIILSLVLFGCKGSEASESAVKGTSEIQEGNITFTTEDDVKISGNIFGTGKKWVILTHMLQSDQQSWFDFAEFLKENNYTALTYDLRGIGRSGGSLGIENIPLDLEAALDFIRQYDNEKIFLIGAAVGGTSSLKVASREQVNGVVSISGLEEYQGLTAMDEIASITCPKLFIVTRGDPNIVSTDTLYNKSSEPKEIKVLEGNEIGTSILEDTSENSQTVKQIILDFLNSN